MKLLDLLNVLHPDTRIKLHKGTFKDPKILFEGMVKDIPYSAIKEVIQTQTVTAIMNISSGAVMTMNILISWVRPEDIF